MIKINIVTKDYKNIRIETSDVIIGEQIVESIKSLAFPYNNKNFDYCERYVKILLKSVKHTKMLLRQANIGRRSIVDQSGLPKNGWDVYKFYSEFERQGVNQTLNLFAQVK